MHASDEDIIAKELYHFSSAEALDEDEEKVAITSIFQEEASTLSTSILLSILDIGGLFKTNIGGVGKFHGRLTGVLHRIRAGE